jgi:hypothetical protein
MDCDSTRQCRKPATSKYGYYARIGRIGSHPSERTAHVAHTRLALSATIWRAGLAPPRLLSLGSQIVKLD